MGTGVLIGSLVLIGCALLDYLLFGFGFVGYFSIVALSLLWIWQFAIIIIRKRRNKESLQTLNGAAISYQLDDTGISASSPLGQSTTPWNTIKEIWIDLDLALVLFRGGGYFTIPRPQISSAALDFFVQRTVDHGGKVVDKSATK